MKEIIATISPDGSSVKIEANGFTDGSCGAIEQRVLAAVGTRTDGDKKPEFFNPVGNGINLGA